MQMNQDGQPAGGSSAPGGGGDGDGDSASLLASRDLELGVIEISSSTVQPGAARSPPRVNGSTTTTTTTVDVIIGMVRPGARNVDPQEYDPHHVSIGPYHHRHLPQEIDKKEGLAAVLSVEAEEEARYLRVLADLEGRARACYREHINMESKEFLCMLLHDACYILACFGSVYPDAGLMADTLRVVRDVFYLAENQLPFFVLEKIAELASHRRAELAPHGGATAVNDIKEYARYLLKERRYSMAEPVPTVPVGNLLHLLHTHLNPTGPPSSQRMGRGEKVTRWRTATDYYLAGVKIKSRAISASGNGNARCILDVKLSGGTLAIPCLDIDGQTWRLLRNLIALEQHNRGTVASHVTAYCVFMSQLACEARDVELLCRKRVIVHSHGNNDEVAGHFADLCKGITFNLDDPSANYLRTTWQKLEKRYRFRPWSWLALLRRKYFSNPVLTAVLVIGIIGLACEVIQAVYAILSYRQ